MIKDLLSKKTDGKQFIEVLVGDDKTVTWVMAMATDLRLMNTNRDLMRVKAVRVRKLDLNEQKKHKTT